LQIAKASAEKIVEGGLSWILMFVRSEGERDSCPYKFSTFGSIRKDQTVISPVITNVGAKKGVTLGRKGSNTG